MKVVLVYQMSRISRACLAAGLIAAAVPASAISVSYTTDTAVFVNFGGTIPGDTLTLGSASGVFDGVGDVPPSAGTYTVYNVTFQGAQSTVTPLPLKGVFHGTATTSAGPFAFSISYLLQRGLVFDTITLGGDNFDAGGYRFKINPLVLAAGPGVTTTAALTATAGLLGVVPEPATWAMLVIGFGAVGVAARSRRFSRAVTA